MRSTLLLKNKNVMKSKKVLLYCKKYIVCVCILQYLSYIYIYKIFFCFFFKNKQNNKYIHKVATFHDRTFNAQSERHV